MLFWRINLITLTVAERTDSRCAFIQRTTNDLIDAKSIPFFPIARCLLVGDNEDDASQTKKNEKQQRSELEDEARWTFADWVVVGSIALFIIRWKSYVSVESFIYHTFSSTIFARTLKIRVCLKYRKNATNKTKHEEYRTDGDDGCVGLYIVAQSSLLRPSMSITNTKKREVITVCRWPSRYSRLSKQELISSRRLIE